MKGSEVFMKQLYVGGPILTMEEPRYAEAVLTENGRILAVGSREALEGPDCQVVELHGSALLPGFVDPHSHFFQVALSLLQVSLDGLDTPEKMKEKISAFVRENKIAPGTWVVARDYDNNIMPGLQHPTLEELDGFCPENPLIIHHKSGHMGLFNSKGLDFLGVTAQTPCPPGGKIEQKDGRLTGYMEENAFFTYMKKIPMQGAEQLLRSFAGGQQVYASYGITTVQDGMVAKEMLPLYRLLLQRNEVGLDVILYAGLDAYDDTVKLLQEFPENRHISCGGLKMFLDGSPQGRTAWMRSPYEGTPDYSGYGTMTDEQVENAFRQAAKAQVQIIAHCNGDAAAEQFLRCLQKVEGEYPILRRLHPVIIHGQLMGRDQVKRAAELGAMISFFVAHTYHWGDVHIRNFGMERASRISPARSAMEAGVNVTFHQDAPVIQPDMLETIWCAACRQTKNGVALAEDERVSTFQALQAVTVNAAKQYGLEKSIGSIAPGKKADFVILDKDPLTVRPQELRSVQVLQTIKEGNVIYTK